jgi:hypothetical protein
MSLHVKEPGANPAKATPLGAGPRRTATEVEALCVSPVAVRPGSPPRECSTLLYPDGLMLCRPSRKFHMCER